MCIRDRVNGATKAPIWAPALNRLVAYALSFLGKYSAVALIAAGKFPASPIARTSRANIKRVTLTDTTRETSPTADIASRAPAKLVVQLPATMPEVTSPQNA